jgi:hypothetical protein
MAAAKAVYAEIVASLWAKYHPEEVPAAEGERFKNRKQAFDWLQAQGYKISRGKFYNDCEAGYPGVHRDGTVSRYQVLQYAQQQDVTRRASATDLDDRRIEADTRKAEADAQKAEMQAEEMRRQQDKLWIQRDRAEEITCVWVSRLRDAVAYHLDKGLLAIIHGCGGKPERQSEVKAIIDSAMASACNEIANAEELTVEIEDLEE